MIDFNMKDRENDPPPNPPRSPLPRHKRQGLDMDHRHDQPGCVLVVDCSALTEGTNALTITRPRQDRFWRSAVSGEGRSLGQESDRTVGRASASGMGREGLQEGAGSDCGGVALGAPLKQGQQPQRLSLSASPSCVVCYDGESGTEEFSFSARIKVRAAHQPLSASCP
jgi:hypothetical protein